MPKLLLKIFLGLAAILLLLAVIRWFAAIDGVTTLQWNGYEVPLRTNAFIGLLAGLFGLIWFVVYLFRRGFGGLYAVVDFFRKRRHERGLNALSRSLIALAEGDGPRALKQAQLAEELLKKHDLTRLVNAQAARMAGDMRLAEKYFEAMSEDRDTSFLGLQGLLSQALREEKPERALRLAERAHALRPRQGEMLDALFKLQRAKGDWAGARRTVQASVRAKRLTRDVGDRRLALLHLVDAEAKEGAGDRSGALREVLASVRLAPGLAPAAAMAARMLTAEGEKRSASRMLVAAWKISPHPDVAAAYAGVEPKESAEERVTRFGRLFDANPKHEETRLLKAELAIAADDLERARDALGDLPETRPSARACALMAAIEQGQGASETIVRGWLSKAAAAPRGAQWACDNCGEVASHWAADCGRCGAFDTLSWKRVGTADGVEDAALFPLLAGPQKRLNGAAKLANTASLPALDAGAPRAG